MATVNLANFFSGAALAIANAQNHPDIAAALDSLGYDAATLQEGQARLDTALNLHTTQIKEYGEQHAATQIFNQTFAQADKNYSNLRRLAKIAFKGDAQRQTTLRLNDRKPKAFNPWHQQARSFYAALLTDSEAQTRLARYKITLATIQAGQSQVEQVFALNSRQQQEKGKAQNATQQRDQAIKSLSEWLSDFKTVARIALADRPQLLEALNLGVIP